MRISLLLLIAMLVAASCAPTATTPAALSPTPREVAPVRALAGEDMRECVVGPASARCGSLLVPVDRAHPDARRIQLNVAVVPAKGGPHATSALFLIAGGPGGASTESYAWAVTSFSAIRTTHDLVLVDQRGTGGSDALRLPAPPDIEAMPEEDRAAAIAAWLDPGFAALPSDVAFYTTRVAADDLDAVRAALGYERIDIYGGSYGATVAQYYARQYPRRVRSVVLDGATLVEVPIMERIALNVQRALDLLFERCETDAPCRAAYPGLRSEFAAILARLADRPVTATDTNGAQVVVDRESFAGAVHQLLLTDRTIADLPHLIHLAFLDRWDDIARAVDVTRNDDTRSLVMSVVIRCSEPWARYDPVEIARIAPESFDTTAQVEWATIQAEVCRHVPAGVIATEDGMPVTSDAPALFLVGGADPQDPLDNVASATAHLPNSRMLGVPGHGHGVAQLGCMGKIVAAFVNAATLDGLDASCIANGGVPLTPFKLPWSDDASGLRP